MDPYVKHGVISDIENDYTYTSGRTSIAPKTIVITLLSPNGLASGTLYLDNEENAINSLFRVKKDNLICYKNKTNAETIRDAANYSELYIYDSKKVEKVVMIGDRVSIYHDSHDKIVDIKYDWDIDEYNKSYEYNKSVRQEFAPIKFIIDREKPIIEDSSLTLGTTRLLIPPISIQVTHKATIQRERPIRSSGSMKAGTGHHQTRVEMLLYFSDVDQINNEDYGLRALIAQFKRTPFLPVRNSLLNNTFNIYALTLSNMIVNLVPGMPNDLQVKLVCYKFNFSAYMPAVSDLGNVLNHKLFKWYYKRGLIHSKDDASMPGKLCPLGYDPFEKKWVDSKTRNEIRFYYPPLDVLQKIKNGNSLTNYRSNAGSPGDNDYEYEKYNTSYIMHDARIIQAVKDILIDIENDVEIEGFESCQKYLKNLTPENIDHLAKRVNNRFIKSVPERRNLGIEYYTNTEKSIESQDLLLEKFGSGHLFIVNLKSKLSTENAGAYLTETDRRVVLVFRNSQEVYIPENLNDINNIRCSEPKTDIIMKNIFSALNSEKISEKASQEKLKMFASQKVFGEDLLEDYLKEWKITYPDRLYVQNITTAYENIITELQMQAQDTPTHQYIGAQDTFIKLEIRTDKEENVKDIRQLFTYITSIPKEFGRYVLNGFVKIKNDIANLFGVYDVVLDHMEVRTVEGLPGVYDIEIIMIDFNLDQRKMERSGGIVGTADSSIRYIEFDSVPENTRMGKELRSNLKLKRNQSNENLRDFMAIRDVLKHFEVYPDLDLPTWEELKDAKDANGNSLRLNEEVMWVELEPESKNKNREVLKHWNGDLKNTPNNGIYVDPDFYFIRDLSNVALLKKQMEEKPVATVIDSDGNAIDIPYGERVEEESLYRVDGRDIDKANEIIADEVIDNSVDEEDYVDITIQEILDRIKACKGPEVPLEIRRKAWPAIPELIDPINRNKKFNWFAKLVRAIVYPGDKDIINLQNQDLQTIGQQYKTLTYEEVKNIVDKYVKKSTLGSSVISKIFYALLYYQSGINQLYPYNLSRKINTFSEGAILGEPVQGVRTIQDSHGNRILEWTPKFGVGQIDIEKELFTEDGSRALDIDGKPLDAVRIVYDYQYNIKHSFKLYAECYEKIYKAYGNDEMKIYALWKYFLKREPNQYEPSPLKQSDYQDDAKLCFDGNYFASAQLIAWMLAAVMYDGFTLEEILFGIEHHGKDSSKGIRPSLAWLTLMSMFGAQPDSSFNKYEDAKFVNEKQFERIVTATSDDPLFGETNHFYYVGNKNPPKYSSTTDVIEDIWYDYINYDCSNRMLKAFPTYHMFLIDEGRKLRWWTMWDNFYGLSSVIDMSIHKSRKNVADTCVVRLLNANGSLGAMSSRGSDTDIKLEWRPIWHILNPFEPIDDKTLELRDRLEPRIAITPGSRISIRMGYGANVSRLPVVFNGTVADVTIGETIELVAQGDGVELTSKLDFGDRPLAGTLNFGAEPRDLILGLMINRSNFKEMLNTATRGLLYDQTERTGVIHFGSVQYTGESGMSYGYVADEIGENIYPCNTKWQIDQTSKTYQGPLINPFVWFGYRNDEKNIQVDVYDRTLWDVIATCALAMPNFVASVVPVGFRSTLFFGMPHYKYVFDWDIENLPKTTEDVIKIRKPFQQWHIYSSYGDIIDNNIKATSSNLHTNVIGSYITANTNILGKAMMLRGQDSASKHEATVRAYADKDIYPQLQRTAQVYTGIRCDGDGLLSKVLDWIPLVGFFKNMTVTQSAAIAVAQSTVRDFMKDMYDGSLVVMGDPSVKPYDTCYLWDKMTEMYGLFEVKEVVHHLSAETGFVTDIKPDLCVAVADPDRHLLWSWGVSLTLGFMVDSILRMVGKTSVTGIVKAIETQTMANINEVGGLGALAQNWGELAKATYGPVTTIAGQGTAAVAVIGGIAQATGDSKAEEEAAKATVYENAILSIDYNSGAVVNLDVLNASKVALQEGGSAAKWGWTGPAGAFLTSVALSALGVISFNPLGWIASAIIIGGLIHTAVDWIKRTADLSQCVVCNFLTLHGKEFSAGVLGHKGIVVGAKTETFSSYETLGIELLGWINNALDTTSAVANKIAAIISGNIENAKSSEFSGTAMFYNSYYNQGHRETRDTHENVHGSPIMRDLTERDERALADGTSLGNMPAIIHGTRVDIRNVIPFATQPPKLRFAISREISNDKMYDVYNKFDSAMPSFVNAFDDFIGKRMYNVIVTSTWEPNPRNNNNLHLDGLAVDIGAVNSVSIRDLPKELDDKPVYIPNIVDLNSYLEMLEKNINNYSQIYMQPLNFIRDLVATNNFTEVYSPLGIYVMENGILVDQIEKWKNMPDGMEKQIFEASLMQKIRLNADRIYIARDPKVISSRGTVE